MKEGSSVESRAVQEISKKASDDVGTRIEVKNRGFEGYGRGFV